MNNSQHQKLMVDFSQVFIGSVSRTLVKNLDTDICNKIGFSLTGVSKVRDVENLKGANAIYKIDYATGNRQGTLVVLVPEELIAAVSDILTGGTGKGSYKGSLTEIETNSLSDIFEKMFKNVEADFKKYYEHDLAFSATPSLLLKEMPTHTVASDESPLDFSIDYKLTLTEDLVFNIIVLLNVSVLDGLMDDLGLVKVASSQVKTNYSLLNVDRLTGVKISVTAELGRARVPIKYALELVRGSLVELDTLNNSDISVFANGVEFAKAQVVAVEDNFGLKITQIVSPKERLESI